MQRLALGSTMEPNSNEGALSINKTGMGSTRWLQVLVCVAQPDGVRDSTDETGVLAFGWTRNDDKLNQFHARGWTVSWGIIQYYQIQFSSYLELQEHLLAPP